MTVGEGVGIDLLCDGDGVVATVGVEEIVGVGVGVGEGVGAILFPIVS